jgi:hypothetical protein
VADGPKSGVKAALARAGVSLPELGPEPEQLALLEGADEVGRGPGRPAGSMNNRTRAMVAYLDKHYRSPLIGLSEIAAMSWIEAVDLLQAGLGCTKLEALREWKSISLGVAEFREQKLARLEVKGDGAPVVQINMDGVTLDMGDDQAEPDVVEVLEGACEKTAENRQFSEDET